MAVGDRHFGLQPHRLVGDAVVVAKAFRLVDSLGKLADLALGPAIRVGDELVVERLEGLARVLIQKRGYAAGADDIS